MLGLAALLLATQYAPTPNRADAIRAHLPPRHAVTTGRPARAARLRALDEAVQGLDPNLRPAAYQISGPTGL
jgi:hypothetical protein